ncbi:MAG: hypothetical protein ACOVT5_04285 [Armatimonadaceae bacterium]
MDQLRQRIAGALPAVDDPEQASVLHLDFSGVYCAANDLGNAEKVVDNAVRLARTVAPADLTPLLWPRLVDCRIRHKNRAGARATAVGALPFLIAIPDPDTRWWALATLAERLATLRDTASVSTITATLRRSDPDRYRRTEGQLLRTQIALASGEYMDALRLSRKLPPDQRASIQVSAATGLYRQGRSGTARALMDGFWAAARRQRNPGLRLLDETVILEGMVRQGRAGDALRMAAIPLLRDAVLEAMLTAGLVRAALKANPSPSPSVVIAWAGEGQRQAAERIHKIVLKEHKWFLDDDPVRMLAARARAAAKAGDSDGGRRLFEDAEAVVEAAKGEAKQTRLRIALAEALQTGGWHLDR